MTRFGLPPLVVARPNSRYAVNTPALMLDLDAYERNLASMAAAMQGFGIALRPHAKMHKSSRISRHQIAAGAVGICCATLDEAEVMAAAGISGILITSPVTTHEKIARLIRLVGDAPDTMIVVDNGQNVDALAHAAEAAGVTVLLLVDLELGFGRTGVPSVNAVVNLTEQIQASAGLRFAGLQAYGGHLQHIANYADRHRQTHGANAFIQGAIKALADHGIAVPIVSGGGTGTHAIDGQAGLFTEIQAGSYLFMDADYGAVTYEADRPWPFEVSLFVQSAVISTNVPGTVTVDAGTKAFALNGPRPQLATATLLGSTYEFTGDEHGRIRLGADCPAPQIGERVELVVSHCDPTVALYDAYHCVRGDVLVGVWPIDARGRR